MRTELAVADEHVGALERATDEGAFEPPVADPRTEDPVYDSESDSALDDPVADGCAEEATEDDDATTEGFVNEDGVAEAEDSAAPDDTFAEEAARAVPAMDDPKMDDAKADESPCVLLASYEEGPAPRPPTPDLPRYEYIRDASSVHTMRVPSSRVGLAEAAVAALRVAAAGGFAVRPPAELGARWSIAGLSFKGRRGGGGTGLGAAGGLARIGGPSA